MSADVLGRSTWRVLDALRAEPRLERPTEKRGMNYPQPRFDELIGIDVARKVVRVRFHEDTLVNAKPITHAFLVVVPGCI
jgi:hypothetical protein